MGIDFIEKIQLYKRNKHLLEECPSLLWNIPTFKWIGSPRQRMSFKANNVCLTGCADTGSDLDFMSLQCAINNGFSIDRRMRSRQCVMLPDEFTVETIGQVHIESMELSEFDNFQMEFHVLPGLPCDVIFGEQFLEETDAFNTCDISHSENSLHLSAFNTLIHVRPAQMSLNRLFRSRKTTTKDTSQRDHAIVWEAETFRRNKVDRLIPKIKDVKLANVARSEEEARRKKFDDRHVDCQHCAERIPQPPSDRRPVPASPLNTDEARINSNSCLAGESRANQLASHQGLAVLSEQHLLENPWR
jgi:hypothetical protein